MNRFSTFGSICCLSIVLSPTLQLGKSETGRPDTTEQLREIVSVLRLVWGPEFESNYRKYMLGSSPTVLLISREEMRKIAAARLDGRRRDGETTQGLTIEDVQNVKIVAVYDGLAPILVAKTIIHELGSLAVERRRFVPQRRRSSCA
jgi:hypothetical protein